MIPKPNNRSQTNLFSSFEDILNSKHPLFILANKVDWNIFEKAFLPLYCQDNGRPAKPID
jgi:IS5 family transposase